ncbi:hypothetical protein [Burkholderia sp. AW49-1]
MSYTCATATALPFEREALGKRGINNLRPRQSPSAFRRSGANAIFPGAVRRLIQASGEFGVWLYLSEVNNRKHSAGFQGNFFAAMHEREKV